MAPPGFHNNKIYYTVADIKSGYSNESNLSGGIYSIMYEKDLSTGAERGLFSDAIRCFCAGDDGKILYAVDDAYSVASRLKEFDPAGGGSRLIMESPYLILNISCGKGMTAVEAKKEGNNSSIYLLDIKTKTFTPVAETPYYETSPAIYGNKIFFQANYGKRYGAYCYDPENKKYYSLTGGGTALAPAFDTESGTLYFVGLNNEGYDIYSEKPEFKEIKLPEEKQDYILPPLLDPSKYTKGSYLDNLAAISPKVRVPLFYLDPQNKPCYGLELIGEDVMGDLTYEAAAVYDSGPGKMDWTLQTLSLLFSPLEFIISAGSGNNGEFSPMLALPFYSSMRPGLSLAYVEIEYDIYNISAGPVKSTRLITALGGNFAWPLTLLNLSLSKLVEPGNGSFDMRGIMLNAVFTQYCGEMKFNLNTGYAYDPDFSGNMLQNIRGYSNALPGNTGTTVLIDITRPLFKVRNGMWNPVNFYIEDICGGIFTDSQLAGGKTQLSCGVEITAETKFLFYLSGPLVLRFSYNRERDFMTTLTFGNLSLPF